MTSTQNYQEYTQLAMKNFAGKGDESRFLLVNAVVESFQPKRVLDVGCGAGQDLLTFLEKTGAFCFGIDAAENMGEIFSGKFDKRVSFARSVGEKLPFADESFDVVLCQVALPYMNNSETIAEIARVLQPGGFFLLKIHAPAFYFEMIRQRVKTGSARQIAYPLICLTAGMWHLITGTQLKNGIWQGKEIFQTKRFLEREFLRNNLQMKRSLPDTNKETPSFLAEKMGAGKNIQNNPGD